MWYNALRMDETVISIRYDKKDMAQAIKICEKNDIDISCYIVQALLHYVELHVRKGDIERPRFMTPEGIAAAARKIAGEPRDGNGERKLRPGRKPWLRISVED